MFTDKEETYILHTLEDINDTVCENNAMLKQIVSVMNKHIANSNAENINDFGMNVLANLISNNVDLSKIFNRSFRK